MPLARPTPGGHAYTRGSAEAADLQIVLRCQSVAFHHSRAGSIQTPLVALSHVTQQPTAVNAAIAKSSKLFAHGMSWMSLLLFPPHSCSPRSLLRCIVWFSGRTSCERVWLLS